MYCLEILSNNHTILY